MGFHNNSRWTIALLWWYYGYTMVIPHTEQQLTNKQSRKDWKTQPIVNSIPDIAGYIMLNIFIGFTHFFTGFSFWAVWPYGLWGCPWEAGVSFETISIRHDQSLHNWGNLCWMINGHLVGGFPGTCLAYFSRWIGNFIIPIDSYFSEG